MILKIKIYAKKIEGGMFKWYIRTLNFFMVVYDKEEEFKRTNKPKLY